MANQHQPFRVHHIARAFRAAERAGIKNPHVRVTLPGGGELHVHGVPDPGPKTSSSVRTSASLAKGGKGSMGDIGVRAFPLAKGGNTPMAGRGERTVTAASDAAGKQQAGSTGHKTASRGSKLAEGGSQHMFPKQAAEPAKAGQTGKEATLAGLKRASGGLSLPAKAGRCGT